MGSYGLQSHIWNNNFKSVLLLILFPVLLLVLFYALVLLFYGVTAGEASVLTLMTDAFISVIDYWPIAFIAAGSWFVIAGLFHQQIINASVKSSNLTRGENPKIYNLLENLCISRGEQMPKLRLINSPSLNAFASGIDDKSYTITVTQGLVDTLEEDELEAVIAHELTHIRNKDVRLLIVSVIFVGIFSFFGEMIFRNMFRVGVRTGGYSRGKNGDSRGGGVIILIAVGVIILSYLLALMVRFMISRKREFMADAGAVELTKNPDAMVRALQKISGKSTLEVSGDVQQMCIDNQVSFAGLFATHPPIEKRIAVLREHAGALV